MNLNFFKYSIASFFAIMLLTFCTQEIEVTPGRLGVEATDAEYEKVLNDALADISILNTKVGDSATYELNQRVELGSVIKTGQITHTLIDIKPVHSIGDFVPDPLTPAFGVTSQMKYILYADEYTFDMQTGGIKDEKHYEMPPLLIESDIATISLSSFHSKIKYMIKGSNCDGVDEVDGDGNAYDCIKRFNLKTQTGFEPAPPAIAAKHNCMDFPNCMIPVTIVSFDEVKWRQGKSVQTVTLTYKFAKDVPDVIYVVGSSGNLIGYMPPVVSFCQRAHIDYEGQDVIITLCNVLKDMTRAE